METPNLKIRVNSPEESERAQRAFFALGYRWKGIGTEILDYCRVADCGYIVAEKKGMIIYLTSEVSPSVFTLAELEALAAERREPQMTADEESAIETEIAEAWHDYQERALTEAEQRSVEVEQRRYEAAVNNYEKKSKFNGEYVNIAEIIFESLKIAAGLLPIPSKNA